jgi:ribosome-associated translation inhibitor RaiA
MITAEHFVLSDDERRGIEDRFQKVEELLRPDSKVHLFIKRDTKGRFRVVATTHSLGRDLAYNAIGTDLQRLFTDARDHLFQNLLANKKRRLRNKRHGDPLSVDSLKTDPI